MAPLPVFDSSLTTTDFDVPVIPYAIQYRPASLSTTLRTAIMILAGMSLATGALYLLLRRQRRRPRQVVVPGTPLLVYESSISIEFDDIEDEEGTVVDESEHMKRASLDTILSNGTARKLTFGVNILPFLEGPIGGILDRRGKANMECDTTAYYETDIVIPTVAKSPIDRTFRRPTIGFMQNIASPLSPFWSRQTTVASPRGPVFGFDAKTITPPMCSPMWSRRVGLRSATEAPNRKKGYWTP